MLVCLKAVHYETAAAGSPESTSSLIPAGKNHTVGVFKLKAIFFPTEISMPFISSNKRFFLSCPFVHYGMCAVEENQACCVLNIGPETSIKGSLISYMYSFDFIEFQMKHMLKRM